MNEADKILFGKSRRLIGFFIYNSLLNTNANGQIFPHFQFQTSNKTLNYSVKLHRPRFTKAR